MNLHLRGNLQICNYMLGDKFLTKENMDGTDF